MNNENWPSATANGIELTDPVVVSFNSDVVVIAREKGKVANKLYYNVRHNDSNTQDGNLEYSGWYELVLSTDAVTSPDPKIEAGSAPKLVGLRELGVGLVTVPSTVLSSLPPSAKAFQAADLPFSALSDERYIYIFRPSVKGTVYLDRFILIQVPAPKADNDQVRRDASSTKPTRYKLERIWESRFRVSGKKDTPADESDVLGYSDMLGNPFIEPTLELSVLPRSADGRFAVALLPTREVDKRCWYFFVAGQNKIQVMSWPQGSDGLFDFLPPAKTNDPLPLPAFDIPTLYEDGTPLTCEAGIGVRVYAEQDASEDGTKLRRAMRLMVAVPVSATGIGLTRALAVYDFNILPSGHLPAPPQPLQSPLLDGELENRKFTPPDPLPEWFPLPSKVVHLAFNSTIYAYLLGGVQSSAKPYLLDGGDGLMHCYYAGLKGQEDHPFLVAQYSPEVQRPSAGLAWTAGDQKGLLNLIARRPGTTLNKLKVTVSKPTGGVMAADLCAITVDYGAAASGIGTENWNGLPRNLTALTDVLNGNASGELSARAVQEGSLRYFDYSGTRYQARLPLSDAAQRTGWLTMVSTRLDLALEKVEVAAGSAPDTVTLVLSFKQRQQTITQTWVDVPVAAGDLRIVLRGDAASYSYQVDASDPWAFAISAAGGTATMLFYASSATDAKETSITISEGDTRDTVNVRLKSSSNFDKTFADQPADSSELAKALLSIPEVTKRFPVISASDSRGTVVPQTASKPVDLRILCLLLGTVPQGIAANVVPKTVAAELLQGHSQDEPHTDKQLVNRLVALSAVPSQLPNNGVSAIVGVEQTADATPASGNGAWVKATPLYALNLPGGAAMTVPTDLPRKDALAPGKTFTLETWLSPNPKPTGNASSRVLSFNGANAGQTPTGKVVPSSFLSVFAQPALQFGLLNSVSGIPSFGSVQPNLLFEPKQAFTWEIWIKAAAKVSPQGVDGALLQVLDPNNPTSFAMDLSLDSSLVPVLTVNDSNGPTKSKASTGLQANVWTHLAVTGKLTDPLKKQWSVSLYKDGQNTSIKDLPLSIDWGITGPPGIFVGGDGGAANPSAAASFAEVRYWQIRRTRTDILDSLYFTLAGTEPGLAGYWPLDGKVANGAPIRNRCPVGGPNFNGVLSVRPDQDAISSADGTFLAMASGIGGAPPLTINSFLRSSHWNHVAVTYRAGTGVHLSGAKRSLVNCGHDSSLNVMDAFSVEAWIEVEKSGQPLPQTLLGKWGKDASEQSYWLGLDAEGNLNLQAQYQYAKGNDKVVKLVNAQTNGTDFRDGMPHHVAAIIRTETKTEKDGNKNTYVEVTVTFYVDGTPKPASPTRIPDATDIYNVFTANVQATTVDLTIGAAAVTPRGIAANTAPEAQMYLNGLLTGAVIWSRAIDSSDIAQSIQEHNTMQREGAIAAWWFLEQAGVDAVDNVGGLVAKLTSNDLWAVYNRLSEVLFYANGRQLLGAENLEKADAPMAKGYPGGPAQFTLGGFQNGASLEDSLVSQLNEVRLWQQVRSQNQIASMRFARLVGNENALSCYWNFDDESLDDRSDFGNNGVMWNKAAAPFVLSAAPVSNEGPAVLNIYGGQATGFQQRLCGTPAVIEFSEVTVEPTSALEPDPKDGQPPKLLGSLERAYYYTTGTVNLTPGFYVGGLRLVYFGQVQTDATLLGYIEGAPPVPSENLTRPFYSSNYGYFGYFNASSITFTNTETTSLTFNSSYSYGSTLDHSTSGGFALKVKIANAEGIGEELVSGIADNEFKIGIKEKGGFSTQDVSIENAGSSWAVATTDTLALRGDWENPDKILNPEVGRRFLPENVGYALVSSLTADVYLTFNAATGAAVGRSIVPNPYIPPDNNIITFRIKPDYVKNGTLDGKVGLYTDPDYLNPPGAVPGSYFKPIESYRLKRQIAKKALDEEKYFEQFDAFKRALGSTTSLQDQEPYRLVERTSNGAVSRKGIANTYVWTAAGGLHTEQEQFTDQFTTTFTGGYNVNNQFGLVVDYKGRNGKAVLLGGFFTLDWLAGFKIGITATKTRTRASAFGLKVNVVGEPALLGGYDKAKQTYPPDPVPGKVAGYRFNTFYLPPDSDNGGTLMNQVVDQEWLRSNEPDAVTLRSANTVNPSWRVLHRVTYVNRIPPGPGNTPNQMLPTPVSHIVDLDNNEVLVELTWAALGGNDPTPPNLGTAVAAVLNPPPGQGGSYPPSKLGALIPWWDEFLATTRGSKDNSTNYELLQGLQLDVLKYLLAGIEDGTLPV